MSRRWRIARNIGIAVGALVILVVVAAIIVARTAWFRDFAKEEIIAAVEEGDRREGGEIGSLALDPLALHAVITGLVIHGSEPAGAAPFVRVPRVEIYVRLFTGRLVDIVYLALHQPQANIIVFPDGTNNVPTPKTKSTSNKIGLETVVDLAIRRADLIQGLATYNSRPQPFDVKANNLHVKLAYDSAAQVYRADVSLKPVYVVSGRNTPLDFTINLPLELRRDRIDFRDASITTGLSRVRIDGSVQNLRSPELSARVNARLALADLRNAVSLPLNLNAPGMPAVVTLQASAFGSGDRIQVSGLRLEVGRSNIEASGALRNPSGGGGLDYRAKLDLGELGRLAGSAVRAEGDVTMKGAAKLDAANRYDVTGAIEARGISMQQGRNARFPYRCGRPAASDAAASDGQRFQAGRAGRRTRRQRNPRRLRPVSLRWRSAASGPPHGCAFIRAIDAVQRRHLRPDLSAWRSEVAGRAEHCGRGAALRCAGAGRHPRVRAPCRRL